MLRDIVQQLIAEAVQSAQADGTLPDLPELEIPMIARPKQADHGDYSSNVALVAAAAVKKATGAKANPRQIGQAVLDHLPASDLIAGAELAGPGFINVRLADGWLQQQIPAIITAGESFGNINRGQNARWQVEYVSANPTGPLHFGGARNAVLGDTVANVLEAAGYDVQREFYVNDGGNQFRLFAESLFVFYLRHFGQEAEVPEGGYPGGYMADYAAQIVAEEGDRFLSMERAEAVTEMVQTGRRIVLANLAEQMAGIDVHFDNWFSEQSLYDEGLVEQSIAYLRERGDVDEHDGAVWFLASKYPKCEKDEVLVRSNGTPTYFAGDIAYHYDKFIRRKFDRVVNVWAVDHQGHVPRMAAMMSAFGLDPERLVILMYDMVKLIRDGQEVKMSKRAGSFLTLEEVVEEVGADPVRFMLLTRSPESTVEFDLTLAVAQSNDNPVYYIQYSHARICSILEKAVNDGIPVPSAGDASVDHLLARLTHPSELALIRKVLELEEQIDLAVDKLSPHNLTYYAMDLAGVFNGFYRDCKVVDADQPALSQARLLLSQAARTALARVLTLMGMSTPESM